MKKRPHNRDSRNKDGRAKQKPHPKPQAAKAPAHKPHGPAPKLVRAKLYGFHAVAEAWLNPDREVQALYVTDQGLKSFEEVLQKARAKGLKRPSPLEVDKHQLEKALPAGAVHQGLALAASDLPESSVADFIIQSSRQKRSQLVMLDQVTDPHNVGAIMRSACVFGIEGLIMQRKHAPFLDGVLAKTACGAVEHVPVAYETNLNRALEELKESGYSVYGLDERGQDLQSVSGFAEKTVLVLGAEGPGLRRLVKENCDFLLRLPTTGPISSLNVSNAAAVAFYALNAAIR